MIHICSFSSPLTARPHSDDEAVLLAMRGVTRVSTFEMTHSLWSALKRLEKRGLVEIDNTTSYPWIGCRLTAEAPR